MRGRIIAAASCVLALAACQQQPASPSAVGGATVSAVASSEAVPTAMVKHEQDVPFSGTIVGHSQFLLTNPRGCEPGYTTVTDGQGPTLHMGLMTAHWEHCVQAGGGWIGEMVMTAANGDKIRAAYDGRRVPGPFPNIGEHLNLYGTWTITSGTGRFEHATGGGEYTGWIVWEGFQDFDSPGEWQYEGRIRY